MEKIAKFQELLKRNDIDVYIICTSDEHFDEYLPENFKLIKYLSNFSGENATLIVTQNEAALWVDGRFFIQAENEIAGTSIKLMKMGEHNVPTVFEYLNNFSYDIFNLGFDGKLVSKKFIDEVKENISRATLIPFEVMDRIWEDRPVLETKLIYTLPSFFSGDSFEQKLEQVKKQMSKLHTDVFILSKLEDQAWLYNLRGSDIDYTEVFLAFTVISKENVDLFVDNKKINDEIKKYLSENKINVHDYEDFYSFLSTFNKNKVLIDPNYINYSTFQAISVNNEIVEANNPTDLLKAIKNDVEIVNTKNAHIKDGVAMVKAIYYMYNHIDELDEISFANYLDTERSKQKGFIDLSFATISAFRDNAALPHYQPKEETNHRFNNEEKTFFLVDSGGHYADGTTDITRTFALGEVSEEMRLHYTHVLKSAIALAKAVFIKGTTGPMLDMIAREPMWRMGLNYNHGTGHGVGHVLAVHEGPQSISYRSKSTTPLEPGMITTDEPGIYIEGKYGIRIENELLCVEAQDNSFGKFYKFEIITFCPIDTKAIDTTMLSNEEREWLNEYHKNVFNKLSPYLTKEEKDWLKEATQEI